MSITYQTVELVSGDWSVFILETNEEGARCPDKASAIAACHQFNTSIKKVGAAIACATAVRR